VALPAEIHDRLHKALRAKLGKDPR